MIWRPSCMKTVMSTAPPPYAPEWSADDAKQVNVTVQPVSNPHVYGQPLTMDPGTAPPPYAPEWSADDAKQVNVTVQPVSNPHVYGQPLTMDPGKDTAALGKPAATSSSGCWRCILDEHGKIRLWACCLIGLLVILVIGGIVGVILAKTLGGDAFGGDTVDLVIQSANTKELWLQRMVEDFNREQEKQHRRRRLQSAPDNGTNDTKRIVAKVHHTGSTYDESLKPNIWSPANRLWVRLKNEETGAVAIVSDIDNLCFSTTTIPLGLAIWRKLATALGWPDADIGWKDIADLAKNESGWGAVDPSLAVRGRFSYGHGHPESSNSGRLSFLASIYAYRGGEDPLQADDLKDAEIVASIRSLARSVTHMGHIDTDILARMVERGPGYLNAVANYESNVISWNKDKAAELSAWDDDFVFIYPSDGTYWMDHPFCVVDGVEWTTDEQAEAALTFIRYVTDKDRNDMLLDYGIRPFSGRREVSSEGFPPFTRENGVIPTKNPTNVPQLPFPDTSVIRAVIDTWKANKKPAVVVLTVDTSGSMRGGKLQEMKAAVGEFLNAMQPHDELYLIRFSEDVQLLEQQSGLIGEKRDELLAVVDNFVAGGATALYNATRDSLELIAAMRAAANDTFDKSWDVVIMTDGMDEGENHISKDEVYSMLPGSEDPTAVHIYSVAFDFNDNSAQAQAGRDFLRTIAEDSNGKYFAPDARSLSLVYNLISQEF
ncbi:unnamed protein product [Vitrella brassicaformis CCMP3155]|uniref:VWFA domain-containing protein n=2 Tax=Vitrella brassicaformis TaxID=1169539 RepID=A0A0G4GNN3_VITBC|nr:unnamed protein product [Vitrella brassicaformis CCMP3155]|eukprot:CEM31883.1 unnamed protein product [Vitrella brassicaformis CCMP3155]